MKLITKTRYPINGTNEDKINYIKRNIGKQCIGLFVNKYYCGILCGFVILDKEVDPLINKPFTYSSKESERFKMKGWNITAGYDHFDECFLGTEDYEVLRIETLEVL